MRFSIFGRCLVAISTLIVVSRQVPNADSATVERSVMMFDLPERRKTFVSLMMSKPEFHAFSTWIESGRNLVAKARENNGPTLLSSVDGCLRRGTSGGVSWDGGCGSR